MEAVAVISLVSTVIQTFESLFFFAEQYGRSGPFVWIFGSREIWRVLAQVLRSTNDTDAMDFKKSVQDDSQVIALAATIVAQIAITALSLDDISRTHWVARAFFTFSLVSSIMAVYYATSQFRILGRCLQAEQVKAWIRGKDKYKKHLYLPSSASVLTVSAPNMLLSSALNSFLIGLGIYLGFTWTRGLDEAAGVDGSRAVFITYLVGLVFCYGVYALSGAVVANESYVSESDLLYGKKQDMLPTTEPNPRDSGNSMNHANGSTFNVPMNDLSVINPEHEAPSRTTSGSSPRQARQANIFEDDAIRQELLKAFQEAAQLRKASTEVDERLVRLLERLG